MEAGNKTEYNSPTLKVTVIDHYCLIHKNFRI